MKLIDWEAAGEEALQQVIRETQALSTARLRADGNPDKAHRRGGRPPGSKSVHKKPLAARCGKIMPCGKPCALRFGHPRGCRTKWGYRYPER